MVAGCARAGGGGVIRCGSPLPCPSSRARHRHAKVLKVGTANLNLDTTDFTPLRQWLASADAPDVVFLQEFTELAQRALDDDAAIAAHYPTAWPCPSPTRLDWRFCRATRWLMRRCCSPHRLRHLLRLRATLLWNGQPVHLSALHPMPPMSSAFAQARDHALGTKPAPVPIRRAGVMAGDLNTTPWARGLWGRSKRRCAAQALGCPPGPMPGAGCRCCRRPCAGLAGVATGGGTHGAGPGLGPPADGGAAGGAVDQASACAPSSVHPRWPPQGTCATVFSAHARSNTSHRAALCHAERALVLPKGMHDHHRHHPHHCIATALPRPA